MASWFFCHAWCLLIQTSGVPAGTSLTLHDFKQVFGAYEEVMCGTAMQMKFGKKFAMLGMRKSSVSSQSLSTDPEQGNSLLLENDTLLCDPLCESLPLCWVCISKVHVLQTHII